MGRIPPPPPPPPRHTPPGQCCEYCGTPDRHGYQCDRCGAPLTMSGRTALTEGSILAFTVHSTTATINGPDGRPSCIARYDERFDITLPPTIRFPLGRTLLLSILGIACRGVGTGHDKIVVYPLINSLGAELLRRLRALIANRANP